MESYDITKDTGICPVNKHGFVGNPLAVEVLT